MSAEEGRESRSPRPFAPSAPVPPGQGTSGSRPGAGRTSWAADPFATSEDPPDPPDDEVGTSGIEEDPSAPTGPPPGGPESALRAADPSGDSEDRAPVPTGPLQGRPAPPGLHAPTPEEQERMVEAVLFASPEPLPTARIAERLPPGCDPRAALSRLQRHYEGRGVNLVRAGGAWAFRTAPDLRFLLSREVVETRKLSRAGIETLAIVAYHGPVTRTEIEEVRGVSVSKGTLDQLMELGWVRLGRRRETPGRPVTYVTTDAFLDHFGLESAADLPGLPDLRAAGFLGDPTVQEDLPLPDPEGD